MQLARRVMVAVLACATCGCAGDATPFAEAVARRDSAAVHIVSSDLTQITRSCQLDDQPRLVVGNRPDDPAHQLHRVFGASLLSDGRLVVVDQGSQRLRFYSAEGDFLTAAGGRGQGPGEFQSAFLLWRQPGDTLWVGDYRPWEFEVFSPEGEWVRSVRPEPWYPNPPRAFALLSDGRAVLGTENITDRSPDFRFQSMSLLSHAAGGALRDTIAVVETMRWGKTSDDPRAGWIYPWFESTIEMTARGDRVILAHGATSELRFYALTDSLELKQIVRWAAPARTVSAADVEAGKQALVAQYADVEGEMRALMVDPLISDDRPAADVFPALIDVQAGTDDSVWIKQYPRPGGPDLATWLRFDSEGTYTCRLEVPAEDFEVVEFGADYIVVEVEDALGVEMVAVYGVAMDL